MKVYLFLTDGFEEIEAVGTIDILRRAGVKVTAVSINGRKEVTGKHNIIITADEVFENCKYEDADMLAIPGGPGVASMKRHQGLLNLVKDHAGKGRWIAAICAAPTILGKLGLLEGKNAVCYPGLEKELKGANICSDNKVVVDGKTLTSRGPGTTFDFGLKIVECLQGPEVAKTVADGMLIDRQG